MSGTASRSRTGSQPTRKLSAAGHAVQVANTRGPASMSELAAESGAVAVTLDEVARDVDALITSIPFSRVPDLRPIIGHLADDIPVADTSNYYPHRDGRIREIDDGKPEGAWVEQKLGRPVVRAWNSLVETTLAGQGRPKGAAGRLAVPVTGSRAADKQLVMGLVDDTGFDLVDAGSAEDSWRIQMATPACCTMLNAEQLRAALAIAEHDAARVRREAILAIVGTWEPDEAFLPDVVALNRAVARLHRLSTGPGNPA
ncbi:NAD(P)-binding domain-containing protein [Amycolatopsis cynarae]|uniref:NAD(P)-binding domain-containing protein n=1 Tax=Amycolatopsis cynarae TaxID=2995223 RepID=A0ABY7BC59_9PSEU|nr:NAD(P)-binding domain-containing protein [Amycolatopsis sp. HUAS 11-8]WAL68827.1 NAD(P)-binding domain-containing protein [Amycolatopsis sp. HUAS 11-8]